MKQERIAAREQAVADLSQVAEEIEPVSDEQTEAVYGDSDESLEEDEQEEMSFGMSY